MRKLIKNIKPSDMDSILASVEKKSNDGIDLVEVAKAIENGNLEELFEEEMEEDKGLMSSTLTQEKINEYATTFKSNTDAAYRWKKDQGIPDDIEESYFEAKNVDKRISHFFNVHKDLKLDDDDIKAISKMVIDRYKEVKIKSDLVLSAKVVSGLVSGLSVIMAGGYGWMYKIQLASDIVRSNLSASDMVINPYILWEGIFLIIWVISTCIWKYLDVYYNSITIDYQPGRFDSKMKIKSKYYNN